MGLTGLLLLAFCLISYVAATLHCSVRVAVRCASSGRQICCPPEFVALRSVFGSVPFSTGPPRWFWPVRRWMSRIDLNLSVRLRPFFQSALLLATFQATLLNQHR